MIKFEFEIFIYFMKVGNFREFGNPMGMSGMGMEIFWEFSNIPKNLGILGMGMKFVGMGIPTVWPSLITTLCDISYVTYLYVKIIFSFVLVNLSSG